MASFRRRSDRATPEEINAEELLRELAWTGLLLSSLAPPRALSVLLADERAWVLAEASPPGFA